MIPTIKEKGLEIGSFVVFDPDSFEGGYRKFIEKMADEHNGEYPLQIFGIDSKTAWITSLKGKSGKTIYASSPGKSHTNFDPRCLKLWVPEPKQNRPKKFWEILWSALTNPSWGFSK